MKLPKILQQKQSSADFLDVLPRVPGQNPAFPFKALKKAAQSGSKFQVLLAPPAASTSKANFKQFVAPRINSFGLVVDLDTWTHFSDFDIDSVRFLCIFDLKYRNVSVFFQGKTLLSNGDMATVGPERVVGLAKSAKMQSLMVVGNSFLIKRWQKMADAVLSDTSSFEALMNRLRQGNPLTSVAPPAPSNQRVTAIIDQGPETVEIEYEPSSRTCYLIPREE